MESFDDIHPGTVPDKTVNKVKEEFYLSLIFVAKWLMLGLGIVGILYFAIYLAYHKSYHDPLMEKYDLEIAELVEQKNSLVKSKNIISLALQANLEKKKGQEKKLSEVKTRLEKIEHKKNELGLSTADKALMVI